MSFIILLGVGVASGLGYYLIVTHSVSLDTNKIEKTKSADSPQIYDRNGIIISPAKENFISLGKLSTDTKNAFICAEDKRFYVHHGLDYIRIGGAVLSNLRSRSFNQGASTISQQLVKNTQLSNEKTIRRKLKEIKLTKQLEQNYSKDEILEMYLNNIYFGNGCYGIENAANHYFGKSADKLSLSESALLAATINAPSVYDIQNNTEKAKERRDLVLDLMLKYNKIGEEACNNAKSEEIKLNLTSLSNNYYVFNEIIEEACSILDMSETQLKNSDVTIHTYFDSKLHDKINSNIKENYNNLEANPDIATIVLDNETGGILSVTGSRRTFESKKQPGSVIKPILVYAPAIENNIISPATKLLDEKIDIGGYSPSNADDKFHGYVSAREALKNSYNIPAVKLLNEIGIQTAQNFAKELGIEFSEKDNNLATSLGGFTDGINLYSIANSYLAFADEGNFKKCKFIDKIVKNGSIIYKNGKTRQKVMKDSTAYLITNMLLDTSKTGTAKRLKSLDYDIASKTGTVGTASTSKNSDAYNISYTSKNLVLSYVGGKVMPESINGATYPTMLTKDIMEILYQDEKPLSFSKPNSVVKAKISKSDYEDNKIMLTDSSDDFIYEVFDKNNLPIEVKPTLDLKLTAFNFSGKKPILSFNVVSGYKYKLIRMENEKEEILSSFDDVSDDKNISFEDKLAKTDGIYTYFVQICENSSNKLYKTNEVKLKSF